MKKIFVILFIFGTIFTSCTKVITNQTPQNDIEASRLNDPASIRAALLGAYSASLSGNYMGLRYFIFADMYADNITHVGTFPSFAQIFNKSITPDNVEITNMWTQIYSGINRCNTVIAAATANTATTFTDKNQVIAEAKVLRAYHYFNLLRYWGGNENGYNQGPDANGKSWGVPLRINPTLTGSDATPIARSSEDDVWKQILADLDPTQVIANLAVTNSANSSYNWRIDQKSGNALLSRVALYRGDWANAEAKATAVISVAGQSLLSNYASLYGNIGPKQEVIWTLPYDPTNQNSVAFFYFTTGYGGRNEISASTGLNNAHEIGDLRKGVNYTTAASAAIAPPAKTLKYTRVSTGDDFIPQIRLAEIYLIRAEARAQQGNLIGAASDLNVVRNRAGLPNTLAVTQSDLLTAILNERRVELAHEGHRFFDLRRYKQLGIIGINTSDPNSAFKCRFPIPLQEILNSGSIMVQNPGY
ncbi:RagB/SusD family nutrient uptake outer membrane protein [Hydrotalea lipotrueae]|uniref:RagB/SusD family nutrient uptake outer membrane protein n=1 Tax=Hydrotalea lipotrueae TaxID=2803817 RepID=UPI001C4858C8|nr:RagB/SusD family nutrient uptake outer membrane protein [Hydrotalea lipotrueae]